MERIGSASGIVSVLEPGQSDADKAARARAEISPLLEKVCEVLNRAKADGLIVSFNCAPDQYGRYKVVDIGVVKPL